MTKRPIILVFLADTHAGSSLGLCPYTFALDDGGYYKASKGQRWMWSRWKLFYSTVKERSERLDAKVVTVHGGDVCEGVHHGSTQISTANKALQKRLAFESLEPLINLSDQVYVIRGTEAHSPSGQLEEAFAEDIDAVKDDYGYSRWDLTLTIRGTKFYFAHHGKIGQLDHTKLNALGNVSYGVMHSFLSTGHKSPDLALFAHNHQYADSYDNYPVRVLLTPGWQLKTGYVYRIKPFAVTQVGGFIITCFDGGKYEVESLRWKVPRPPPVKVDL